MTSHLCTWLDERHGSDMAAAHTGLPHAGICSRSMSAEVQENWV